MRDLVPASARPALAGRDHCRRRESRCTNRRTVPARPRWRDRARPAQPGGRGIASRPLARLSASRRMAVVLRVSPDLLLEREVVVPLAAEQDLRRVITYEMDRLTPFRADEVFWTCDADRRDPARNRLHARVTIVPRVRVQPVLAALHRAGLVPMRIEAGGSAGSHTYYPHSTGARLAATGSGHAPMRMRWAAAACWRLPPSRCRSSSSPSRGPASTRGSRR